MVTRSVVDYQQHKKDIYETLKNSYGEKTAQDFITMYAQRYDRFGRSFIDYRFAFALMDEFKYVQRVGSRWYAIVGVGGTGKTTVGKNGQYFLDPLFDMSRLCNQFKNWVRIINVLKDKPMSCIHMDEPDDTINPNSKEGKKIREVCGKLRFKKLMLFFCATDLKDIPPFIFRKLDGIIFCPQLGKGMFFKNRPKKGEYILQRIRNDYAVKGYKIFFELQNAKGCLKFDTLRDSPLDLTEGMEYLNTKEKDFNRSLDDAMQLFADKSEVKDAAVRDRVIKELTDRGWSQRDIAPIIGLTQARVNQLLVKLPKINDK
jgi:hypothetical protein